MIPIIVFGGIAVFLIAFIVLALYLLSREDDGRHIFDHDQAEIIPVIMPPAPGRWPRPGEWPDRLDDLIDAWTLPEQMCWAIPARELLQLEASETDRLLDLADQVLGAAA